MEGRPGDIPDRGAQPFSASQLEKVKQAAGPDLFIFLLLRGTGMRGSEVVGLTWGDVHFDRREIERITQKRRKPVIIPIHSELLFALQVEFERRSPDPEDQVLEQTNVDITVSRLLDADHHVQKPTPCGRSQLC
jgi:integrase